MSKMNTARGSSLSFQASCSIVSSNTKALPGSHCRCWPPTRKPQPGGTMSGRCTIRRVLLTPVCGGIRVLVSRIENSALGLAPGTSQRGQLSRAADSSGTSSQMLRVGDAVAPQVVDAPPARLMQVAPFLFDRTAGAVRNIRFERSAVFGQHVDQLRANVVRRSLDRIQPGEIGALVEFDGRQLREIQERRLLLIDALPLQQDREAAIESMQRDLARTRPAVSSSALREMTRARGCWLRRPAWHGRAAHSSTQARVSSA